MIGVSLTSAPIVTSASRTALAIAAGFVHGIKTQRVDLWQLLGRLAAERRRRHTALRAAHIGEPLDEEMLLERDLPGHPSLPFAASATG